MLTRIVRDGRTWIQSADGFKVEILISFSNDPTGILYSERSQNLWLDLLMRWESEKDERNAIHRQSLAVSRIRQLLANAVLEISVPKDLKWLETREIVSLEDRERILGNIRIALEFEKRRLRFVDVSQH